MKIIRNKKELDSFLIEMREKNQKIGLIPTMGSIHKGHISLVKKSLESQLISMATIYINPTQFNSIDDYNKYPKSLEKDIKLLRDINCNAIYLPNEKEIYPKGIKSKKKVHKYRNILCDKYRAGHFDGVTTVIESLFNMIKPQYAFFGEKDFQQLKIIKNLKEILSLKIKIIQCPSIRHKNGISFSSRLINLSTKDKDILNKSAKLFTRLIEDIKHNTKKVNFEYYKSTLLKLGVKNIEYLEIREEENLNTSLECFNSRLFVSIYIGSIRLIDNFKLY